MAPKTVLIFLFVAIMAISAAEAQLVIVNVNGTLYCNSNGSPGANGNATPVFPNAFVEIVCSPDVLANTAVPINATTNASGFYRAFFVLRQNATVDLVISNCRGFVATPLSNCNPTLPSVGLVSNLRFVTTVHSRCCGRAQLIWLQQVSHSKCNRSSNMNS